MSPRRSQAPTVLIQDRSRLFRESLRMVLADDSAVSVSVSATVATGDDLVAVCALMPIDAVVLEAAGVPWDVPELIGQLDHVEVPLGGVVEGALRRMGRHQEHSDLHGQPFGDFS